jgi:cytochrome P450
VRLSLLVEFWLAEQNIAGYTVAVPYNTAGSLVGQLDPVEHSKRRKIWDRAFTPAAVKSYEPLLQKRVAQLMQELSNRSNQPVDLAEWTSFMSMDFMGDFAYGGMFDSMAHGAETTGAREVMIKIVTTADAIGTLPWLRPIFVQLIKYGNPFFQNAAMAVVNKRLEKGSEYRDLFYYLVGHPACLPSSRACIDLEAQLNEDGEGTHPSLNKPTLASEAVLAILAGSDTTATALANAMYYLMTHPTCMTRLRAEVDAAADPGTEIDADKLVELSYLQAVISETLRLQPAIPNGVQRMPPHHGGPVIVAGQ